MTSSHSTKLSVTRFTREAEMLQYYFQYCTLHQLLPQIMYLVPAQELTKYLIHWQSQLYWRWWKDSMVRKSLVYSVWAKLSIAVVLPVLGTIFAYGQTSSGKTYTMMGSEMEYGVIPLSISEIFKFIENVSHEWPTLTSLLCVCVCVHACAVCGML